MARPGGGTKHRVSRELLTSCREAFVIFLTAFVNFRRRRPSVIGSDRTEGKIMTPKSLISLACGTALLAFSQPVLAKDPSPKKLLEMSAGCAYVVSIAEGSDVTLNYGSADWLGLVRIIEQRTGLLYLEPDGSHQKITPLDVPAAR